MKNFFQFKKGNRLWIFILAVIIIPNIIEESLNMIFHFKFNHTIWYEVVDTVIVLVIAAPIFTYLIKRMDDYSNQLEEQLIKNSEITKQLKIKNEQLNHQAYYDYLTGLPNRFMLFENLNRFIANMDSQKKQMAIMFIDLDRFKTINDTLGHISGDYLIQQVAKRLRKSIPEEDFVYRHGGDEFIILLEETDKEQYTKIASSILDLFSSPFSVNNERLFTTASIGISIYPFHGEDAETLIKNADTAMYEAKERGKNTYQLYNSEPDDKIIRRMKLENGLRTVLENNELSIYYQPQVNLRTGKIKGVEALLRWHHPELGFIPPDEFIPLAEETGAIISIGEWVLETACKQAKSWQMSVFPSLCVSVNVSIRQIKEDNFVDIVSNILQKSELEPSYLELEITETLMQNIDTSLTIFNQLKKLGVQISIDDFGTGYSSLSLLAHLPIDYLKIDRSFTNNMLEHSNTISIVKTIINMGRNLNLKIVAEGIEEERQELFLSQHGCHIGQGYYYSRPIPVEELSELLEQQYEPVSKAY
ncbi:putative bifunctional diguanylate cyclase/phosphodiesterase [Metabacillus fastidiosus]|uniref:putative bifunctional diguanylate cyclase/phosphodiesterase n=1 Tax=Metabacillus fastidiosus TaxID=1458 RepID=UPI002E217EF7|nr:EAL domain-containing protein [Metabacillus fastidiosus]